MSVVALRADVPEARARARRAMERDPDLSSSATNLLVQALERAVRAEEQAKNAVSRVEALEKTTNQIVQALSDLRLEVGKVGTKMGMWGAIGAVLGAALASGVSAMIVWYVTRGAVQN